MAPSIFWCVLYLIFTKKQPKPDQKPKKIEVFGVILSCFYEKNKGCTTITTFREQIALGIQDRLVAENQASHRPTFLFESVSQR